MATLIKTVKANYDTGTGEPIQFECQCSKLEITDDPTTETVTTFCGVEESGTPKRKFTVGGFQDWGTVNSFCELIHQAYLADPVEPIDFVAQVGKATRTFQAKPIADPPFGGEAGPPLKFEISLSILGTPVDGTVP